MCLGCKKNDHIQLAVWSSGMIRASGAGGPGFTSRLRLLGLFLLGLAVCVEVGCLFSVLTLAVCVEVGCVCRGWLCVSRLAVCVEVGCVC